MRHHVNGAQSEAVKATWKSPGRPPRPRLRYTHQSLQHDVSAPFDHQHSHALPLSLPPSLSPLPSPPPTRRLSHRSLVRGRGPRRHPRTHSSAIDCTLHNDRLGRRASVLRLVGKVGPNAPSLHQLSAPTTLLHSTVMARLCGRHHV